MTTEPLTDEEFAALTAHFENPRTGGQVADLGVELTERPETEGRTPPVELLGTMATFVLGFRAGRRQS